MNYSTYIYDQVSFLSDVHYSRVTCIIVFIKPILCDTVTSGPPQIFSINAVFSSFLQGLEIEAVRVFRARWNSWRWSTSIQSTVPRFPWNFLASITIFSEFRCVHELNISKLSQLIRRNLLTIKTSPQLVVCWCWASFMSQFSRKSIFLFLVISWHACWLVMELLKSEARCRCFHGPANTWQLEWGHNLLELWEWQVGTISILGCNHDTIVVRLPQVIPLLMEMFSIAKSTVTLHKMVTHSGRIWVQILPTQIQPYDVRIQDLFC